MTHITLVVTKIYVIYDFFKIIWLMCPYWSKNTHIFF